VYSTKHARRARNASGEPETPVITVIYGNTRANIERGARFEWPFRSGSASTQYGEAREVRLHGGIVTGAASVPAPRRFNQSGAHVEGFALAWWQILVTPGPKAARGRARVAAQLQAPQRPHRHTIRFGSLCHTFSGVAGEVLVVEAVSIALGARRTNPLLAP